MRQAQRISWIEQRVPLGTVRFCLAALAVVMTGSLVPAAASVGAGGEPPAASVVALGGKITVSAVVSHLEVSPGQTFYVALQIHLADGWIYYGPDPGSSGEFTPLPASVAVESPFVAVAAVASWPEAKPHSYLLGGKQYTSNVYEGNLVVVVPLRLPHEPPKPPTEIALRLGGQICGQGKCLALDVPTPLVVKAPVVVASAPVANPQWLPGLAEAAQGRPIPGQTTGAKDEVKASGPSNGAVPWPPRSTGEAMPPDTASRPTAAWPAALARPSSPPAPGKGLTLPGGLGLALLAGLILNIMPCVLPVVPLRILSIVQMAGGSRRRYVTLGLAFAGGIVSFFVLAGVLNAVLKLATGEALNWAQHFQLAPVRVALAMVLVALAANLFGLFNVVVPGRVAAVESKGQGHLSSAGMGFMMAVLATPCSFGPLVAALSWAQGQPLATGTAAIALLGVGMAAPHAVLAAFPSLVDRLPRPGRWMELFRQAMGFALLAAAIWLISTVANTLWVLLFALVLCFALWMWGTWVRYGDSLGRKIVIRSLAVTITAAAGLWMLPPQAPAAVAFAPYDDARAQQATREGRIVLVKFTADWCFSCQLLEHTVYRDPAVARELQRRGVLAFKADVTNAGATRDVLYGRLKSAPPLTVLYPPDGDPIFLSGEFTSRELIDAIEATAQHTK